VVDKRLLIVESEFAGPLRAGSRDGSTLTTTIWQAWDSDQLRTMAKNNGERATGAHVNIIAHITPAELSRYLDRSELASGLVNRFLVIASRRSRFLPDGEEIPDSILAAFAGHLREARKWATDPRGRRLRRDAAAAEIWHDVYQHKLAQERRGLFGDATSRAEAQVLRLSVVFAALDRSETIRSEHLNAALEVWRYAEDSARWVFGDATGDPTADAILSALRRNGEMDRTAIYEALGRHVSGAKIDLALDMLQRLKLVDVRKEPTKGRPREIWFLR
jgi:hypothetical protein